MERLPFEKNTTSSQASKQEAVRGILQRLLRMTSRVMAKKLFERTQTGADQANRKMRLPKR